MKRIKGQYRQGDVLVFDRKEKPKRGEEIPREGGRVVLAHGEVTGHAHVIGERGCSLYQDDSVRSAPDAMALIGIAGGLVADRLLVTKQPVPLEHEEHDKIPLPAAAEKTVRIQVQWDPSAQISNVVD